VVTNNEFVKLNNENGTICVDTDPKTINEKWLNNVCVDPKTDNSLCNDENFETTNDKWTNSVCQGTIRDPIIVEFKNVEITNWTAPSNVTKIKVLLVGGGGGGSYGHANNCIQYSPLSGPGGGGQVIEKEITVIPNTTYFIKIGGGGSINQHGGDTDFDTTRALGGHAGIRSHKSNCGYFNNLTSTKFSGGGIGGSPSIDQSLLNNLGYNGGYNGGKGVKIYNYGAGAGQKGQDASLNACSGKGGDGLPSNITGTQKYYGGGGSGAIWTSCQGSASLGGGGYCINSYTNCTNGTANTGGGGASLQNGGSGIVIIKY
jgi:hypothetical protein